MSKTAARLDLAKDARAHRKEVTRIARRLLAIPSMTPPGDTTESVRELIDILRDLPGIELQEVRTASHVSNLVVTVKGSEAGRRLVFNGHLDTFPIGDRARWTVDPLGEERNGRLYGLGVSDMKGGVAAAVFALKVLARHRAEFKGEVVGTFVGDEETASGLLGTQYLIENIPQARGDVMISGDIGSPAVLRFGEKGAIWMTIKSSGTAAHAAHVHKGDSAIERIVRVMHDLSALREIIPDAPPAVANAIERASATSERESGAGETDTLRRVTVTFGTIRGGRLPNLVADEAEMTVDIRLPVGATVAEMTARIDEILSKHHHVTSSIDVSFDPTWTDPDHEALAILADNCRSVLDVNPVVNMRIGVSDARLFRQAGIPSIVCGLTPHNLGTADEYVDVSELESLGEIFAMSAYDYLNA